MSNFAEKLIKVANGNEATKGIIDEENAKALEKLSSHMLEVNEHLNLTAIKDEDGVILKHLVDSSACVPYVPENALLVDIGCGGGFPCLVIAILRGDVSVLGINEETIQPDYVYKSYFEKINKVKIENACFPARKEDAAAVPVPTPVSGISARDPSIVHRNKSLPGVCR